MKSGHDGNRRHCSEDEQSPAAAAAGTVRCSSMLSNFLRWKEEEKDMMKPNISYIFASGNT